MEASIPTVQLYRNWSAICGISNPHFKLFVVLEKIEVVLAALSPQAIALYFVEQKPEQDGPWPLSVIVRIVDETIYDSSPEWFDEILTKMGVPLVYFYAPCCADEHDDSWIRIAPDVAEAIWKASDGGKQRYVVVKIDGVDCLFLYFFSGNKHTDPPLNDSSTIWGYAIPVALINMLV